MEDTKETAHQEINWDITQGDLRRITEIIDRAIESGVIPKNKRQEIVMDLNAAHANGCPLDLQKLLEFPDFDFAHDVCGINRHIDRRTGELTGFFLPRCAKATGVQA